jgi:hypothetical protein
MSATNNGPFQFEVKIFPFHYLDSAENIDVEVAFDNVRITQMDAVEMTFSSTYNMIWSWTVSAKELLKLSQGGSGHDAWTPPFPELEQLIEDSLNVDPQAVLLKWDHEKRILVATQIVNVAASFREPMELQNFPVDVQRFREPSPSPSPSLKP